VKQSDCEYVFTSRRIRRSPRAWVLEEQMAQLRKSVRHTFLTEAGEYTDPFTLQYVAGHNNIKTYMRYVHPRERRLRNCCAGLGNL